jgi:hypothetical protein
LDLSKAAPGRQGGYADLVERRPAHSIEELKPAPPDFVLRQDTPARELIRRLRSIAGEVDGMWQEALQSQDFDLVWRSSEASHAVHRAVLALEVDALTIG